MTQQTSNSETLAQEPPALPEDPNQAIQEMMQTVNLFRAVMVKETAALESSNAAAFLFLQDEKLHAARRYQANMADLLARKDEVRAADPVLCKRLKEAQQDFHEIAEKNLKGLERMRKGTDRLRDKIMDAARTTAMKDRQISYGAAGTLKDGVKASMGLSESA